MADLIERDAVLKKIATLRKAYMLYEPAGMGGISAIFHCRNIVNEIPAVNRWIPCSERLPEKWKNVLVVLNCNGYRNINIAEMFEDGRWIVGGEFWYEKNDPGITHWMPLPELPESVIEEMHEKG